MPEATLNGQILDDGGLDCQARFQYGTTPALGTFTPWLPGPYRTGDTFFAHIAGFPPNTNIYFQAEAQNAIGISVGSIRSFIASAAGGGGLGGGGIITAAVDIEETTMITAHSARLNGRVSNQGYRVGSVRFQYGATVKYGMLTPWQNGFGTGDAFFADIENLSEGSAYHARAEFEGSPSVFSKDGSFSTLAEIGGLTLIDDELIHALMEV